MWNLQKSGSWSACEQCPVWFIAQGRENALGQDVLVHDYLNVKSYRFSAAPSARADTTVRLTNYVKLSMLFSHLGWTKHGSVC